MEQVRIAGVVVALLLAAYGIIKYRRGGWGRGDLLISLLIASGVGMVSVVPQVGEVFGWLFSLENRAFALLSFSTLLLFGLFLYLLGQARTASSRSREIVRATAIRRYVDRYSEPGLLRGNPEPARGRGKIFIVIPAFNEGGVIGGVLDKVPEEIYGYEVKTVVVVDGATDATEAATLEAGFPVTALTVRLGKGDAMRVGFEIARLEKADVVVTLDADGQYQPEEIESVVEPVVEDEADFVIGSRFLGYYEEAGSIRHAGVVFFSRMVSLLTGHSITDCTSGLRAIRRTELDKLDLREKQFETNEVLLEAARNKLRIMEVPATMRRRAEGKSKKPPKLAYPLGVLRVILQTWLR